MIASVTIICVTALLGMALHWYLYRREQPVNPALAGILTQLDKHTADIREIRDRTSSLSLKQGLRL
jgi:hypothetical protein